VDLIEAGEARRQIAERTHRGRQQDDQDNDPLDRLSAFGRRQQQREDQARQRRVEDEMGEASRLEADPPAQGISGSDDQQERDDVRDED
jgi:hypothetical protein